MAATMNAATFMGKNFMDIQNSIKNSTHGSHFEENVRHLREIGERTRRDQQFGQDSLGKKFMETTVIDW